MTPLIDEIFIAAPPRTVYALARQTARWPEFLPHYRYVRTLSDVDGRKTIDMAAYRGWIPVRWRAIQIDDDVTPAIAFKHIGGWTAGMSVLWRFAPFGSGTRVAIEHDLRFRFPMSLPLVADRAIGHFFIRHVAQQTLESMKRVVERENRG